MPPVARVSQVCGEQAAGPAPGGARGAQGTQGRRGEAEDRHTDVGARPFCPELAFVRGTAAASRPSQGLLLDDSQVCPLLSLLLARPCVGARSSLITRSLSQSITVTKESKNDTEK